MSREIVRRPIVYDDLLGVADYIARSNLDAAFRFIDAAEETFRYLAQNPEVGDPCHFRGGLLRWRVRGFPKQLVFYFVAETEVEIVRVLHAARDWQSILDRV